MEEDAFLRKLLERPADDVTRLVYADWLEEQGTDEASRKAEFLRLTCELRGADLPEQAPVRDRLRELAADFDPDWLAVVSRLKLEGCRTRRKAEPPVRTVYDGHVYEHRPPLFTYVCTKSWADMTPTEDRAVRFCDDCRKPVYYCDTIQSARQHVTELHCIAVDLGIPRWDGDITPDSGGVERDELDDGTVVESVSTAGLIDFEAFAKWQEQRRPDPVSEARERRKAQRGATGE